LVSIAGLGVNLIGLFFFHDHSGHDHSGHDHSGHSHSHHDHDHENENLYGVFLHILADCLGSVGVIVSSMLVKYYGLYIADPICSFIISLMILASSVPFIQTTASTLMMRGGKVMQRRVNKVGGKISKLDGVVAVR
jgi:solute carrier family 30 (zinc transporter), member 5/7